MGKRKTIIHVNQHEIKKNRKNGTVNPVLTVKVGSNARKADGTNVYANEAIIRDSTGKEVARVVYRPSKPLSCGAHVWIETYTDVETSSKRQKKPARKKPRKKPTRIEYQRKRDKAGRWTHWKVDRKGKRSRISKTVYDRRRKARK
jgi:hypothetical protein